MGRLILGLVAVVGSVMAAVAQADVILWNDEQATIDSTHEEVNLYDTSHAFVISGGDVTELYAHDSSTVDMSDGRVERCLHL